MNRPMLLSVLAAATACALCVIVIRYWLRRNPRFFSRLMDRYRVRPSRIFAFGSITWGLLSLIVACNLPMKIWPIQFMYIINAALATAIGVDMYQNPPAQEFRPSWYQGDGNPDWLVGRPKRKFTPQISLASVSAATFVLCIYFAVYSNRLANERAYLDRREATVQRIQELGGTVQAGMVSLAGTDVADDDLAMLVDLEIDDLNLGATSITNAGLLHIAKLKGILALNLSGTQVDDQGLVQLSKLRGLQILKLRMTKVTGTGFPLANRTYSSLDLSLCPVSVEGLNCLAKAPLGLLNLSQTEIDDSMLGALTLLQVQAIDVTRTKLTAKGSQVLADALPKTNVRRQ